MPVSKTESYLRQVEECIALAKVATRTKCERTITRPPTAISLGGSRAIGNQLRAAFGSQPNPVAPSATT